MPFAVLDIFLILYKTFLFVNLFKIKQQILILNGISRNKNKNLDIIAIFVTNYFKIINEKIGNVYAQKISFDTANPRTFTNLILPL